MQGIKLKAPNEQTRKTNKNLDTDNGVVVTRGSEGFVKVKGGQVYGDRRRLDIGLGAHSAVYR